MGRALILLVAFTSGCDDARTSCTEPLDAWCARGNCGSYEDGVAELRQLAAWRSCYRCFLGECDGLRIVYYSNGLFGDVKYYTDAGELTGVRAFSDAIDGECRGRDNYGNVPQCNYSVSEEVVDASESGLRSSR